MVDWSDVSPETERQIIARLAKGGMFPANRFRMRSDLWPALLKLENEGIVWRAFDHENWETLHLWKITGCGLIAAHMWS